MRNMPEASVTFRHSEVVRNAAAETAKIRDNKRSKLRAAGRAKLEELAEGLGLVFNVRANVEDLTDAVSLRADRILRETGEDRSVARESPTYRLELLRWRLEDMRDRAQALVVKFAEEVVKDPAYKMGWSMDAFSAAARVKVSNELLRWLEPRSEEELAAVNERRAQEGQPPLTDAVLLEIANEQVTRNALRLARSPARSTSPVSNLLEQEECRSWAELAEKMDGGGFFWW